MRPYVLVFLLVAFILMSSCGGSPNASTSMNSTSEVQITETGSDTPEVVTETIRMNNCGGKGDARQIAQRSLSVSIEGETGLGIDAKLVRADIIARYTESRGVSKIIELVAPPSTDMEFTVVWTEQQWLGTITSSSGSSGVRYRARVPIAVELLNSLDHSSETCPRNGPQPPILTTIPPSQANPVTMEPTLVVLPTSQLPSPQPSPTPDPSTPPGSILEVGQGWRQGGYELILRDFGQNPTDVLFSFELISHKTTRVAIAFSLDVISVSDNLGSQLPSGDHRGWACEEKKQTIEPKEKEWLTCTGAYPYIVVPVDTTDLSRTEIIISVPKFLEITDAQWRIPIPH